MCVQVLPASSDFQTPSPELRAPGAVGLARPDPDDVRVRRGHGDVADRELGLGVEDGLERRAVVDRLPDAAVARADVERIEVLARRARRDGEARHPGAGPVGAEGAAGEALEQVFGEVAGRGRRGCPGLAARAITTRSDGRGDHSDSGFLFMAPPASGVCHGSTLYFKHGLKTNFRAGLIRNLMPVSPIWRVHGTRIERYMSPRRRLPAVSALGYNKSWLSRS